MPPPTSIRSLLYLTSACVHSLWLVYGYKIWVTQANFSSIAALPCYFAAIREDRTRGGRSTYQCSYNFPAPAAAAAGSGAGPLPSSSTSPESPSAQPPPTMIPQPASVIPRTISTSWSEQPFPDSSRNSPDQVHMVRPTPPPPPLLLGASPSSLRQEPTFVPPLLKVHKHFMIDCHDRYHLSKPSYYLVDL